MKTTAVAGLLLAWSTIALAEQQYAAQVGAYVERSGLELSLQDREIAERDCATYTATATRAIPSSATCAATVTRTVYPGSEDIDPFIIAHLREFGQEFCTSYNSYTAPVVTAEPAAATITETAAVTTEVVTASSVVIITSTRGVPVKRGLSEQKRAPNNDYGIVVEDVAGEYENKPTPAKRHVQRHVHQTPVANKRNNYGIIVKTAAPEFADKPSPAKRNVEKREVSTPGPIASFPPYLISAACSSVATGNITVNRTTSVAPITITDRPVSTSTTTVYTTETVPGIVLASPTALVGDTNSSPDNYDDQSYDLALPFAIGAYGVYSDNMWLSTNGLITVTMERDYNNRPLPAADVPSLTVFAFWTDLYIRQGYPQGIFYEVTGPMGNRNLTFEFYTTRRAHWDEYYHFTVAFYEAEQGIIDLRYYEMSGDGAVGTVGVQDRTANRYLQYSHLQPIVYPGLHLRFDTTGTGNGTIVTL